MSRYFADVDNRRAVQRLEEISPRVRESLLNVIGEFKDTLVAEVRAKAPVKTGAYRDSIHGIVYASNATVRSVIKAGSREAFYAHILEYGATLPEHDIVDAEGIMHFEEGGTDGFAKSVHFPGVALPERDIVTGPFKAARTKIETAIKEAVKDAASAP